jgi:uncharacterized YccA/Bax inhibitor family protein
MICPKCGAEQGEENLECMRCGVIFAKLTPEDFVQSHGRSSSSQSSVKKAKQPILTTVNSGGDNMALMRTANPALNQKTFTTFEYAGYGESTMTLQGTVNKTAVLLGITWFVALYTWNMFFKAGNPDMAIPLMIVGMIGGCIVATVTVFNKTWSPLTAPIYAALEGLFLGGFSAIFEMQFKGIVVQAIGLTFGTLFCLLAAYTSGLIKTTENFKLGVVSATGGIFLLYSITWILSLFGIRMPYIHESGMIGIGFSLFVVVIAALNLVLDFDFIENGAASGVPKYMEWYGAFGLLVTLVWLYLEILHLLSKLRSRD